METLCKFDGPFDLVIIAGMVGSPLNVMISTDSIEWKTIKTLPKSGYSRMWSKHMISYDEQEPIFIRLQQEKSAEGPRIFDVYIAVQGEKSQNLLKELEEELTGITSTKVKQEIPAGIYNLRGMRMNQLQRGLNIIVTTDGQVRKVLK
jgi:hypothetical protein